MGNEKTEPPPGEEPAWKHGAKLALVFAAYFVTGKIGLSLDAVSGFATLVWPPTGIALAALLLGGMRLWPAVAAGAFVVNLTTGAQVPVAAGIAAGNTLEAVVGASLLRRMGFQNSLERLRDVALLVGPAALLSTTVSAAIGPLSLLAGGLIRLPAYGPTAWAWWVGDVMGDVLVASFILAWSGLRPRFPEPRRAAEAAALAAAVAGIGTLVFGGALKTGLGGFPFAYLALLPLVWAALRFNLRGATAAALATSLLAVAATTYGLGPFTAPSLNQSLTLLEIFMGVVAGTAMVVASVSTEKRRAEGGLRESEESYRLLTETAAEAILTIDESSTIRFANRAAERLFGHSIAEMVGRPLVMLIPERLREKHLTSFRRYRETGEKHIPWSGVELPGLHKSGREIPIEISFNEYTVRGRRLFTGIVRDLTERKRAERAKAELREFLEE